MMVAEGVGGGGERRGKIEGETASLGFC